MCGLQLKREGGGGKWEGWEVCGRGGREGEVHHNCTLRKYLYYTVLSGIAHSWMYLATSEENDKIHLQAIATPVSNLLYAN